MLQPITEKAWGGEIVGTGWPRVMKEILMPYGRIFGPYRNGFCATYVVGGQT